MTLNASAVKVFAYQAQGPEGQPMNGTIEAQSPDQAMGLLQRLQIRVLDLKEAPKAPTRRGLSLDDLQAINQQLIHLAQSGFPMEAGLRLIAQDLGSGRLSRAVNDLAAELEAGTSLPQAIEKHRGVFPAAYARVLDAGARSGSLAPVLLSLARHLELTRRLRAALWNCLSYPLMVLIVLCAVLLLLDLYVVPEYFKIFGDFKMSLPELTRSLPYVARGMPILLGAILGIIALPAILRGILKMMGRDTSLPDAILHSLPLIGPVLKRSLAAQWCDAVKVGVDAGMDLPASMALAGDVCGTRALAQDGQAMEALVASGATLHAGVKLRLLPPTVPAAIAHASAVGDLPATLQSLSDLYQKQAESRLQALPAILTPAMLLFVGAFIAYAILAMVMPMIALIGAVGGGGK